MFHQTKRKLTFILVLLFTHSCQSSALWLARAKAAEHYEHFDEAAMVGCFFLANFFFFKVYTIKSGLFERNVSTVIQMGSRISRATAPRAAARVRRYGAASRRTARRPSRTEHRNDGQREEDTINDDNDNNRDDNSDEEADV